MIGESLDKVFGFDLDWESFRVDVDKVSASGVYEAFLEKNQIYRELEAKAKTVRYLRPGILNNPSSQVGKPLLDIEGIGVYVLGPPEDMRYVRQDETRRPGELFVQSNILEGDYAFRQALLGIDNTNFWHYVRRSPFDEEFILPVPTDQNGKPQNFEELMGPAGRPSDPVHGRFDTPISQKLNSRLKTLRDTEVYKRYYGIDSHRPEGEPAAAGKDQPTARSLPDNEEAQQQTPPSKDEWRRIDYDWLQVADELALKLNSHTNNTSLVLAFEILDTQDVMLFPGDAQYGVWLAWDDDYEQDKAYQEKVKGGLKADEPAHKRKYIWKAAGGEAGRTVTVEQLLAKTVLYKVGHHGSHNATPQRTGLAKFSAPALMALVPVDGKIAQKYHWNDIPYQNLLRAFEDRKVCCFRSDALQEVPVTATKWSAHGHISYRRVNEPDLECPYFECTITVPPPDTL